MEFESRKDYDEALLKDKQYMGQSIQPNVFVESIFLFTFRRPTCSISGQRYVELFPDFGGRY